MQCRRSLRDQLGRIVIARSLGEATKQVTPICRNNDEVVPASLHLESAEAHAVSDRFAATLGPVKKTYNKYMSIKIVTAMML